MAKYKHPTIQDGTFTHEGQVHAVVNGVVTIHGQHTPPEKLELIDEPAPVETASEDQAPAGGDSSFDPNNNSGEAGEPVAHEPASEEEPVADEPDAPVEKRRKR